MKRIYAMIALGGFLLVAGILAPTWAYPHLAVIPADLDTEVVAQSPPGAPATYFSIPDLREETAELTSVTAARVDAAASDQASDELGREVRVIDIYACTDLAATNCRTVQYPLTGALSILAVDPHTGDPVTWNDASIETAGAKEAGVTFDGLTVKFPFQTQKQTYEFWDGDLRAATPVHYLKESSVDGLKVLEFQRDVEPTVLGKLDVPGSVIDRPDPSVTIEQVVSGSTTYLVEPETGVVISASATLDNYATYRGKRALTITDGTFVTPDDVAADAAGTYKTLSRALFGLRVLLPATAIPAGVLLLLLAAALAWRRKSI